MKEITTTITKGGQITLPAEARRALGVKPGDRVSVQIDEHEVRVAPVKYTLAQLKGIVKQPTRTEDFEDMIREAQEEMVDSGLTRE